MRRLMGVFLISLGFCGGASAQLDCESLGQMADVLDEAADELYRYDSIDVDSQVDSDLIEIAEGLREIALYYEGDGQLVWSADQMIEGWEYYNLDQVQAGLDNAVDRLDALWDRDCY